MANKPRKLQLFRSANIATDKAAAIAKFTDNIITPGDGEVALSRYYETVGGVSVVKAVMGIYTTVGGSSSWTIIEDPSYVESLVNALDKAASSESGKVVTTVTQSDGLVSETKSLLKDVALIGYVNDTDVTGSILPEDSLRMALNKLENKASESTEHTIDITDTNLDVNIKESGNGFVNQLKNDGNGNGLYVVNKIEQAISEDLRGESDYQDILRAYKLTSDSVNVNGSVLIKIHRPGDGLTLDSSDKTKVNVDSQSESIITVYSQNGGTNTTAPVLSVGNNGVKIDNIQDAIDAAKNELTQVIGSTDDSNGHSYLDFSGNIIGTPDNIKDALLNLDGKCLIEVFSSDNSLTVEAIGATQNNKQKISVNISTANANPLTNTNNGLFVGNIVCGDYAI